MDIDLLFRFVAALGLGVLLGLERQRTHGAEGVFAGVRTMGLIALLGATCTYLSQRADVGWMIPVVFASLAALVIVSYAITAAAGDLGITTEVTALVTFLIGVLCMSDYVEVAGVVAVACLLLLSLKRPLHALAERIQSSDVEATLKFAIITLIVLPLLPDRNFGPAGLEVINPYEIWLMVVLISGLDFAGYVLVKLLGDEHGLALTGLLGGLVSSTAATLGFARRSRDEPELAPGLAIGILLAWTVMFFRTALVVAVVSPALAGRLGPGLGLMGVAGLIMSLLLWRRVGAAEKATVGSGANPFELSQALKFGLLFGGVTFLARAAEVYLGDFGLYLASALAGLTDVDAISLSMAKLSQQSPGDVGVAARAVLIAVVANTAAKGAMTLTLGSPGLRRNMAVVAGILVAVGLVAIYVVP